VRRADAAGCPVIALTVDLQAGANRLTAARSIRHDTRNCTSCHSSDRTRLAGFITGKPMFSGLDISTVTDLTPVDMSWDYLKRLRDIWPCTLVIKGIVTREDVELAVDHGVDSLIVSNHGGRAEDSGRVPVLIDGGFHSRHRAAVHLGPGVVRTGRRREGARNPAE
jgi:4-hydroxymandelate oxidase